MSEQDEASTERCRSRSYYLQVEHQEYLERKAVELSERAGFKVSVSRALQSILEQLMELEEK